MPMTFLFKNGWKKAIFPLEDKLQPGDQYHLAKVAFAEYLTSGIGLF